MIYLIMLQFRNYSTGYKHKADRKSAGDSPDSATIELVMLDGQECSYNVLIIKMSDYSIEDLFRDKLYMLIPFYIFNFDKQLKKINDSETITDEFIEKYRETFTRLENELENDALSSVSYDTIIRLA